MSRTSAIIVAAGKGNRMGLDRPKQYLLLDDRPVLSHTLSVFNECNEIDGIILVLPEEDFNFCRNSILDDIRIRKPLKLVSGGKERQDSVGRGLEAVEDPEGIVVIHDGVRPFIKNSEITECIRQARKTGACALGVHAQDTLKQTDPEGDVLQTLERENIWMVQTPQAFRVRIIKTAHEHAAKTGHRATDDARLVELTGHPVRMLKGSRINFKITTPEDLELARAVVMFRSMT
ncbi:MAG: 2-C-methyl-D-erythritol 4-phosphate cytidylyltransferase [Thermodesulfobacteriota bacterium]